MYCPKCGNMTAEGMEYCPKCGAKIRFLFEAEEEKEPASLKQSTSANNEDMPESAEKQEKTHRNPGKMTGNISAESKRKTDKKGKKSSAGIVIAAVAACIAVALFAIFVLVPNFRYNDAVSLYDSEKYEDAITAFEALNGYKDSEEQILRCEEAIRESAYQSAKESYEAGDYEKAIEAFAALSGYKDSEDLALEAKKGKDYQDANALFAAGNYDASAMAFAALSNYKDSEELCLESKYAAAQLLYESGDYTASAELFKTIEGYKDSSDNYTESRYQSAVLSYENGEYATASAEFKVLGNYMDSENYLNYCRLELASVGNTVMFGKNIQSNDGTEWIVLAREEDRILVMSKYALASEPYHDKNESVTWETCSLRSWLNGSFLKSAFTEEEQEAIPEVTVTADNNPKYGTNPGNDTQDRIFLLSVPEAEKYCRNADVGKCVPSDRAVRQGIWTGDNKLGNKATCWWWLRSAGCAQNYAAGVYSNGTVSTNGSFVNTDYYGVRPAMWIDLKSLG